MNQENNKSSNLRARIEYALEYSMFASRWLMAPVYVVLSLSLAFIMIKVLQEFFLQIMSYDPATQAWIFFKFFNAGLKDMLLFVLHIVDMALIGNLVLMIIFAGYENFVSKIDVAKDSEDKPSWMGKVDFSGLKLKLVASIVAISGINLLEAFMDIKNHSDTEIKWQIIIHLVFIVSGVLLALMDYIASKTKKEVIASKTKKEV